MQALAMLFYIMFAAPQTNDRDIPMPSEILRSPFEHVVDLPSPFNATYARQEFTNFRDNAAKAYQLANDVVGARAPRDAGKKAKKLAAKLEKIRRYLYSGMTVTSLSVVPAATSDEAKQRLIQTLNAIRSDLLELGRPDAPKYDVRVAARVAQQIETARQAALAICRRGL